MARQAVAVSVLAPWSPGCPRREAARKWVRAKIETEHPDWEIIEGASPPGPFSRAAAILDAFSRASAERLIALDYDVWCDPTEALDQVDDYGWAMPHRLVHRLSAEATALVLAGADWRGLPLSRDNAQDAKPYKGSEAGGLVVFHRSALEVAPPDPRFVGWGQEDVAHAAALRTLVGRPWRGTDDLIHLWHPPQPRMNRRVGNRESMALMRRYVAARGHKNRMRRIIEEFQPPAAATD